jgi:hypothetical protein
MTVAEAFGDVAEIIARLDPVTIAALKAPKAMNDRVSELVHKKKEGQITPEENAELERFLALDIFIGLAKAHSREFLATA